MLRQERIAGWLERLRPAATAPALAVATALLLALSYPKAGLSWLAWVALLPLGLLVLSARSWKKTLAWSYATWFLFNLLALYWIYPVCRAGGLSPALSLAALAMLSAVMALEGAVLGWMLFFLARSAKWFPVTASCAVVAVEWLKAEFLPANLISFPWFLLSYTQWQHPLVLQMASVTGAVGLAFFIAYPAFSLAYAAHSSWRNWKQTLAAPAAALAALLVFGGYQLAKDRAHSAGPSIRIAVLQPNIEQYRKWDEEYLHWIERRLNEQLPQAAMLNPKLVLWPEAAVPDWLNSSYAAWIGARASGMKAHQLVGALMRDEGRNFVRAVLFDDTGRINGFYTKRQLVPFGEYVPLRSMLERHVRILGKMGEFSEGPMDQSPLSVEGASIGPLICYESIFPALSRRAAERGAQVLVNLTNDGWYMETAAPYQHFSANVLRAVENRRPLVRAANTGISGWIDRCGRVRQATALNTSAVLAFDVPLDRPEKTFYTEQGNLLAGMCLLVLLPFLIVGLIM